MPSPIDTTIYPIDIARFCIKQRRKCFQNEDYAHAYEPISFLLSELHSHTEFRHECLLKTDISNGTVIYLSSLLFEQHFIEETAKKLLKEAPNLRLLLTLNKLKLPCEIYNHINTGDINPITNDLQARKRGFKLEYTLQAEMSWQIDAGTAAVHFYSVYSSA